MSDTILTGRAAIEHAEAQGLTLGKYADPTEGAREGLTVAEAREVAREDPGLLWIDAAVRCAYCGTHVEDPSPVPAVDDGAAWAALAALHGGGCEWIETRAHRYGQ